MEFRTLAADSERNNEVPQGILVSRLNEQIKDELAVREDLASLDNLIALAIKLNNRFCERCRERASHQLLMPTSRSSPPLFAGASAASSPRLCDFPNTLSTPGEEPMQLGLDQQSISLPAFPAGQKKRLTSSCGGSGEPNL